MKVTIVTTPEVVRTLKELAAADGLGASTELEQACWNHIRLTQAAQRGGIIKYWYPGLTGWATAAFSWWRPRRWPVRVRQWAYRHDIW